MGVWVFFVALALVGAAGVYGYGRALYRVGYWRGWEARQELEMRIGELRAEESARRAALYAGVERVGRALRQEREGDA